MGPSHFIIPIGFTDPAKSEIQGRQNPLVRTDSSHTEILKLSVAVHSQKEAAGKIKSKNIVILDSYFDTEIVSKNVLRIDIPGQGTYIETARINHRSVTILDKDTTRMLCCYIYCIHYTLPVYFGLFW